MPDMNPAQRRAVEFKDGAMLLLAGPGSGKTTVITHRIRALTESGVDPGSILVITFTRAAALEMQDRFMSMVYPDEPAVQFGTFHAIFYSIIKHHRSYHKVVPITAKEKLNMISRALEISDSVSICDDFEDRIRLLNLISSCKNNGNDPCVFRQEMMDPDVFVRVFEAYNGLLVDFDLIDFDDMVNVCLDLLKSDKDFARSWQERFGYILIDEFQDISGNQYELVKLLAYPQMNIFAVGDDDQSIYAFRGSDVSLMKRFMTEIPGARKEYLSVNYRCSGHIVDFAGRIISDNKERFSKDITSGRDEGCGVELIRAQDQADQNTHILRLIHQSLESGVRPEEIAILTRTNRQAALYAALLKAHDIQCAYDETEVPFTSVYVRDIEAYMAVASGEETREHLLRIINRPVRYIKRAALSAERVTSADLRVYYRNDPYMLKRIDDMYRHLDRIRHMSPHLAVRYICNTVGYGEYVKENDGIKRYEDFLEQKDALISIIRECTSYSQMKELLDRVRLSSIEESQKKTEGPGIRIRTYHASKGLEYDTVIIPDVNEGRLPSKAAHTEADIAEERRMFYVAMTRARDRLHILYRTDDDRKPSRFIKKA